jgi:hypothetical protein
MSAGAWFRMADGTAVHVKFAAPRRKRCKFCDPTKANFATLQCDYPIGNGKTCDAFMCAACARCVGMDRDYCPDHAGRR